MPMHQYCPKQKHTELTSTTTNTNITNRPTNLGTGIFVSAAQNVRPRQGLKHRRLLHQFHFHFHVHSHACQCLHHLPILRFSNQSCPHRLDSFSRPLPCQCRCRCQCHFQCQCQILCAGYPRQRFWFWHWHFHCSDLATHQRYCGCVQCCCCWRHYQYCCCWWWWCCYCLRVWNRS